MSSNMVHLLKTRRFLPLFITQFFGAFNDNVFKNAFAILITYKLSQHSMWSPQLLVTFAAGLFILPFLIFSALAGDVADKFEKSKLISIIKTIEIILAMLAAIGFYDNNVFLLLLVLFMFGMHSTFFGPLKYALLPEHLEIHELIAGNGLIEAGTFLAILLGTILGGILILLPQGIFFISCTLLSVSLIGFFSSLFIPKTKAHAKIVALNFNIFTETWRILKYAYSLQTLFPAVIGISWFWFLGAVFLAEFPIFSKADLHADQYVVTYFFALFSLGIGLGSLACNRLLKGQLKLCYVPFSAIMITVFTLDLYFTAQSYINVSGEWQTLIVFLQTFSGWRISLDILLIAVAGGLYTVPLYVMLQQLSEESHRARVIASNNVMNALFMVAAALATMLMLKKGFSVSQVFFSVALVNVIIAIFLYFKLPNLPIKK